MIMYDQCSSEETFGRIYSGPPNIKANVMTKNTPRLGGTDCWNFPTGNLDEMLDIHHGTIVPGQCGQAYLIQKQTN